MTRKSELSAYGLLFINMVIWGGHAVVARAAAGEIPPMTLNFWRWALGLCLLLPFALPHLRREWPLIRANLAMFTLAGTANIAFTGLYYLALNHTTSISASLINMSMPVFVVIMTWAARMEFIGARQAFGLAVSLAGVLVIVVRGDPAVLLTLEFNPGDLIVLAAMFGLGLYSIFLRRLPGGFHVLTLMAGMMAITMPVLAVPYAIEYAAVGGFAMTRGNLLIIAFVVLGPAVFTYFSWIWCVRLLGANKASFANCIVPVFVAVLAWIFLGETLKAYHFAGFAVICVGMYFAVLGRGRVVPPPEAVGPVRD